MKPEISSQPLLLRGSRLAAADLAAVAVQHDHVPGTQVVAVVALLRVPRRGAEVLEVPACSRSHVFVVADRRMSARFLTPPRRGIAVRELLVCPALVHVVAKRRHRAWQTVEQ